MIPKRLDSITLEDIESLIDNEQREDRTTEYKRSLYGASDSDKKEFLADVSSFANAIGGDLIFGVDAKDGVPISADGLKVFNQDKEILRLTQTIRSGLSPVIANYHFQVVPGFPDGPVLILRIARSWRGPHMITTRSPVFYSRHGNGKAPMDSSELRIAFENAGDIPKQIRKWRDDRLQMIDAGRGPLQLDPRHCYVLHAIPIESYADTWRFSADTMEKQWGRLQPLGGCGTNFHYNMDGVISLCSIEGSLVSDSYTQLFRSGALESVTNDVVGRNGYADAYWIEREIVTVMIQYLEVLQKLELPPPIAVMLSILNSKGVSTMHGKHSRSPTAIDRDLLTTPDVLIDDLTIDVTSVLRPVFDALWNAFGMPRSASYDAKGKFRWDMP
jgi:Schlafen, AlbA_2